MGYGFLSFSWGIFQLLFAQSSLDCESTKADIDENNGIIPKVNERKTDIRAKIPIQPQACLRQTLKMMLLKSTIYPLI